MKFDLEIARFIANNDPNILFYDLISQILIMICTRKRLNMIYCPKK